MTAIGGNNIGKVYLGSNEVSKMYLGSDLVYQNVVVPPNYLCFTALADGTFTLTIGASVTTDNVSYVEYSLDDGETWTKTYNVANTEVNITTPTIVTGDKVLWRGSATKMGNSIDNYSVFSSSANYEASGNVCSLLYGDNKSAYNSISSTYTFVRLFYNSAKLKSISGIVFPNNVTDYCYARMFMGCTGLTTVFDTLSAESISTQCYNRMFSGCSNITKAPSILATSATGIYVIQYCFQNCSKLAHIMCLLTSKTSTTLLSWVLGVASSGVFVKNITASWTDSGNSGVPTNWTVIYYAPTDNKYYTSKDKSQECDENGNPIT